MQPAGPADERDFGAVRGEREAAVLGSDCGELLGGGRRCGFGGGPCAGFGGRSVHALHRAQRVVGPRGEVDGAGARVDDGAGLVRVGSGEVVRAVLVVQPQLAEGLGDDPPGRSLTPPVGAGAVARLGDLGREADGLGHLAAHGGAEGDGLDVAADDIDAGKAALVADQHRAAVGVPGQVRVGAVGGAGVLPVAVEAGQQNPFLARGHVHEDEDGALHATVEIGELGAVGGRGRLKGAAGALDDDLGRPGGHVMGLDAGAAGRDDVGVEAEGIGRLVLVLEEEAVGVGQRAGAVDGAVAGDQRLKAAGQVEGDQLAWDAVADCARKDPGAVSRPRWPMQIDVGPVGYGAEFARCPVEHLDLVAAAAVRREGDPLPVAAVSRGQVPGSPRGEGDGLAARDRHLVDRAEEVEDDGGAVGRDVDAHPCAFSGVEGEFANGAGVGFDGPRGLLGVDGKAHHHCREG